jgi:hypothetical protein
MMTLTNLIPDVYAALDTVQRELVGVIPGVTLDAQVARAAIGQTVRSPVAPAATATDVTPGVTPPDDGDQNIGNVSIAITKSRRVPIRWNGEQSRGVNNGGPGQNTIFRDQVAQAIRTLVNEIETDVVNEARKSASRAYGTAGTTPFGTANDLTDSSSVLQIIEDNGGAGLERSLVLSSAAMNNIRGKQAVLFKVNESGTADLLRRGVLGDLHGAQARQSAQLKQVTKGTGAGYLVNNAAGYNVGDTAIAVDTGTGTILAGDVIGLNGDTNKYVVTGALSNGVITIGAPGLRAAVADNTAITVGNNFTPSVLFAKSAVVLATRAPALPTDPSGREVDLAEDRMTITDPVTGLSLELSVYLQYRQIQYELAIAWGQKGVKQENIALLLG